MKIVHVIGYFQPELGYEEYYLAKYQAKLGHDVHVITSDRIWPFENVEDILKKIGSPYQDRMRPIGDSNVDGIRVHRLPAIYEFSDFVLVKGIEKLLNNIKPDVVHAHEARQGTPVLPSLYKSIGYVYIIDHHGYKMPDGYKAKIEYKMFRKIITEFAFKKADAVLPINDYIEKYLISTHKIDKRKIHIINTGIIAEGNGVDTDIYYFDNKSREDIRKCFNISDSDVLLVFAGKMDNRKGLEVLIRAFSKIIKNNSVKLLLIGSGDNEYIEKLLCLTYKQSCRDHVIFHDFVNSRELYKLYSAADIAVFPKSASITIREAMACGLPIILPKGGREEKLINFENGLLFSPNDEDDLTKKITELVVDIQLRKLMSNNSVKAVNEFLSYENISAETIRIYKELIDHKHNLFSD